MMMIDASHDFARRKRWHSRPNVARPVVLEGAWWLTMRIEGLTTEDHAVDYSKQPPVCNDT